MARTNVYYEHNRVISPIEITAENFYAAGSAPGGETVAVTVDVVHEVQLADREGNLVVLHFNVPSPAAGTFAKTRQFTPTGGGNMPAGLFTQDIKDNGDTYRNLLGLPQDAG